MCVNQWGGGHGRGRVGALRGSLCVCTQAEVGAEPPTLDFTLKLVLSDGSEVPAGEAENRPMSGAAGVEQVGSRRCGVERRGGWGDGYGHERMRRWAGPRRPWRGCLVVVREAGPLFCVMVTPLS
jgi:hypothetical protein